MALIDNLGRRRSIRVTVPASVAGDLDSFQKGLAVVAERLGCPACFSGVDCRFQIERGIVLDERLDARFAERPDEPGLKAELGAALDDTSRTVTANIPTGLKLADIQAAVASIADRLGCLACCSGFDIEFQQEIDFLVGREGKIRPVGTF